MTLRWDGQAWIHEPAPKGTYFGSLRTVSIAAANDVWAVGEADPSFHLNSSGWTKIRFPEFNGGFNASTVDAVSPTEAWAVGFGEPRCCPRNRMVRWDGEAWTKVATPDLKGVDYLLSIDVQGSSGWTTGQTYVRNLGVRPLARHWDGTEWSRVGIEKVAARNWFLRAVVTAPDGTAWSTGGYGSLKEHGMLQRAC